MLASLASFPLTSIRTFIPASSVIRCLSASSNLRENVTSLRENVTSLRRVGRGQMASTAPTGSNGASVDFPAERTKFPGTEIPVRVSTWARSHDWIENLARASTGSREKREWRDWREKRERGDWRSSQNPGGDWRSAGEAKRRLKTGCSINERKIESATGTLQVQNLIMKFEAMTFVEKRGFVKEFSSRKDVQNLVRKFEALTFRGSHFTETKESYQPTKESQKPAQRPSDYGKRRLRMMVESAIPSFNFGGSKTCLEDLLRATRKAQEPTDAGDQRRLKDMGNWLFEKVADVSRSMDWDTSIVGQGRGGGGGAGGGRRIRPGGLGLVAAATPLVLGGGDGDDGDDGDDGEEPRHGSKNQFADDLNLSSTSQSEKGLNNAPKLDAENQNNSKEAENRLADIENLLKLSAGSRRLCGDEPDPISRYEDCIKEKMDDKDTAYSEAELSLEEKNLGVIARAIQKIKADQEMKTCEDEKEKKEGNKISDMENEKMKKDKKDDEEENEKYKQIKKDKDYKVEKIYILDEKKKKDKDYKVEETYKLDEKKKKDKTNEKDESKKKDKKDVNKEDKNKKGKDKKDKDQEKKEKGKKDDDEKEKDTKDKVKKYNDKKDNDEKDNDKKEKVKKDNDKMEKHKRNKDKKNRDEKDMDKRDKGKKDNKKKDKDKKTEHDIECTMQYKCKDNICTCKIEAEKEDGTKYTIECFCVDDNSVCICKVDPKIGKDKSKKSKHDDEKKGDKKTKSKKEKKNKKKNKNKDKNKKKEKTNKNETKKEKEEKDEILRNIRPI